MWTYRATCLRWIDGDTIDLRLDLGFNTFSEQRIRLAGLDAPELRSRDPASRVAALAARLRAEALLPVGAACTVTTEKGDPTDRWGRFVGCITLADGRDLAAQMLAEGHARPYGGGAR